MAESIKGINFEEELKRAKAALEALPGLPVEMVINEGETDFERYHIARALERAFILGRAEVLEAAVTGGSLREPPSYTEELLDRLLPSTRAALTMDLMEEGVDLAGGPMPRPDEHLFGEKVF